jgi:hypothetical protein
VRAAAIRFLSTSICRLAPGLAFAAKIHLRYPVDVSRVQFIPPALPKLIPSALARVVEAAEEQPALTAAAPPIMELAGQFKLLFVCFTGLH